jgi:3-oxo-5alpha-steroid 4-dehydrogenase
MAKGKAWLIHDEPLREEIAQEIGVLKKMFFQKIQFKAMLGEYTRSADTLAELAGKIGVPAARLEATIAEYNRRIEAGETDALRKSPKMCQKIERGPFHATAIGAGLKLSPTSAITVGGLVVDEDTGEVLSNEGGKVPGLYAAGRTAVGLCSHYYVSGLSLGDCVWSGLRAAESIRGNGGAAALAAA